MHAELEDARHNFRDARDRLVVFTELFIRSLRDPAIAQIFKKLDESWRGYLVGLIEQGIRQGIFRAELDPDRYRNAGHASDQRVRLSDAW